MLTLGGVFPDVKEELFFNHGQYWTDKEATETMRNSLMFKMCYYRTHEVMLHPSYPMGFDLVRNAAPYPTPITLDHFEEVFTSSRWIVRIYKVKDEPNRHKAIKSRYSLEKSN